MAAEKKLVKSKSGLRMVPVNESQASPFTIAEPRWIPDSQCPSCAQCQGKFDLITRKHHCRRCGKCFCDTCSSLKMLLPRMLFVDPVRHCVACSNLSKKEIEFFEKHIKTLTSGGAFLISQNCVTTDTADEEFVCKLSPDTRHLQFENAQMRLDDILLTDIESLQILTTEADTEGNTIASGLALRYKDSHGERQVLKMLVKPGANLKQAQKWIGSMQKAFRMVYDTRNS